MTKKLFQVLLGLTLIYTGVLHLATQRQEFQAQVPSWLPLDPDFVVVASGVVEILLGMIILGLLWYAVDALILAPIERATGQRWGTVAR